MSHHVMQTMYCITLTLIVIACRSNWAGEPEDLSPPADEQQVPFAMHSTMTTVPRITVGLKNSAAELRGEDNRALQAAVDYIAGLGGGTVEIMAGTYTMFDSLHLRSNITVRATSGAVTLRKAHGTTTALALDGDYGEQQVTVGDVTGFKVGYGIAIWDDRSGGFHTTVARITGCRGNTMAIDMPLGADCMVANHARAATVFPVISGYDVHDVQIENLVIDGNRQHNDPLNGCRGGGIFLYRGHGTAIRDCTVRNYNGDGISFQQSNDVTVINCRSEDNAGLGFHPGSGSQRPTIRKCIARGNGTDGLFLCWRVRHGTFEDNILQGNGRYGISIGHKDSDNLLCRNRVIGNGHEGVYFRNETRGMAPHRNVLVDNVIENNGTVAPAAGIRIRGEVNGIVLRTNIIRDTRPADQRKQLRGIVIEKSVGPITLDGNTVMGQPAVDDQRDGAAK